MTDEQRWVSLVARYDKYVVRNDEGCWGWSLAVHENPGYPILGTGKYDQITAHRLSYRIHIGDPGNLWVLHHCDTKVCTRPDHLYLGDQWDNGRDIRSRRTSLKQTCRAGHLRTAVNTYTRVDSRGYVERHCRTCDATTLAAREAKKRNAA